MEATALAVVGVVALGTTLVSIVGVGLGFGGSTRFCVAAFGFGSGLLVGLAMYQSPRASAAAATKAAGFHIWLKRFWDGGGVLAKLVSVWLGLLRIEEVEGGGVWTAEGWLGWLS